MKGRGETSLASNDNYVCLYISSALALVCLVICHVKTDLSILKGELFTIGVSQCVTLYINIA